MRFALSHPTDIFSHQLHKRDGAEPGAARVSVAHDYHGDHPAAQPSQQEVITLYLLSLTLTTDCGL